MTKVILLTSGTSWPVPLDWNSANNTIECIAGGASGAAAHGNNSSARATGGGAGVWSKKSNVTLTRGGTASFQVGVGGAAVSVTSNSTSSNGNPGTATWFNGTALNSASCSADFGRAGSASLANATVAASAGGLFSNSIGDTGRNGGSSGALTVATANFVMTSGGGGAAGPSTAGGNSADGSVNGASSSGGTSDGTVAGGANAFAGNAGNGSSGTQWTSNPGGVTVGTGSGGGSSVNASASSMTAGSGGNYGGAGGGVAAAASGTITLTSGAGAPGLIIITYSPASVQGYIF